MTGEQIFFYAMLGVMLLMVIRKQILVRGLKNYSPAEAKEKAKAGSILLDVRTAGERSSSSIPHSIHIPLHEIGAKLKDLEKYRGKEIICYCATGSRSVNAAIKLKKAGFTAGNLKGGMASWNFSRS